MLEIYNFYIFDRRGACLFYHEWSREHSPDPEGDPKLVFGLLFSLKQLASKLSPSGQQPSAQPDGGELNAERLLDRANAGNVSSFSTDKFTLHQLESVSGVRFVLNTQKCKEQLLKDVQNTLRMIYSELYINFVTKNPLYKPGDKITSQAFASQLDRQMVAMAKRFA